MADFTLAGSRGPIAGSITGSGPCLVLAAGLGATRSLWGDLPRSLGRRFTVISIDNPGVGGSRGGDAFTIDAAADALAEAAQHLGYARWSVLGATRTVCPAW